MDRELWGRIDFESFNLPEAKKYGFFYHCRGDLLTRSIMLRREIIRQLLQCITVHLVASSTPSLMETILRRNLTNLKHIANCLMVCVIIISTGHYNIYIY